MLDSAYGNIFIVTSRILGYDGQLSRFGFETVTMERLSPSLINSLIKKWYSVLKVEHLADSLIEVLTENPQIAELAVNPMLLSLIVLVQYVRGVIPHRRHILYEDCLNILVERRYASPPVQKAYNDVLPANEAIDLLKAIANEFHKQRVRELPRAELERSILPSILKTMPLTRAASVDPAETIRNIEARSQVLVERGFDTSRKPVMAFSHLTFQEYLSAVFYKELTAKRGQTFINKTLIDYYEDDPDWWEQVALLYAAHLDGQQHRT